MINRMLDWMGEHPYLTVILLLLLATGGCSIGIHVGIISKSTKLMPY
jgi:hypothetical protein